MDVSPIIVLPAGPLQPTTGSVPALFTAAGSSAAHRFIEFFTANIRNRHTRAAYARSAAQFARWCDAHRLSLDQLTPVSIAAYVEGMLRNWGSASPNPASSSIWPPYACCSTIW